MSEVLHANIFFVITSVAVVIFSILVSLILWQLLKLIQAIRRVVERIEAASDQMADDMAQLRSTMMSGGWLVRLLSFFSGSRRSRDE